MFTNKKEINALVEAIALKKEAGDKKFDELVDSLNNLINNDFEKLLQVLYSVDVDELKLKQTLQDQKDKNAGVLIANLLIQRQIQKNEYRSNNTQNSSQIPEDEKW